jgi:tetratricopeptide (TPR) repeat protein
MAQKHSIRKTVSLSYTLIAFLVAILASAITLYHSSVLFFTAGNFYFGNTQKHYNLERAQRFFLYASYPLFGQAHPFAHYQLSRTYFIQGNFAWAIKEADKELALYPDHCRTHYIRGLTYGYMNNLDKAIEDFTAFNDTCVKNSWAGHNDLAWFYFRKGDITHMRETIEPMAALYPTNPWVQNTYGIALLNLKDYKAAQGAFEKAKLAARYMNEESWGMAYPGNNPEIYGKGLEAMRATIEANRLLTEETMRVKPSGTSTTKNH